jgi:hypothetical protein
MKFLVSYTAREVGTPDEAIKANRRLLEVFSKWQPEPSQNIQAFLNRLDGRGGYTIVETDDAAGLLLSSDEFSPWFNFEVIPVMDVADAVAVGERAMAFLESIP